MDERNKERRCYDVIIKFNTMQMKREKKHGKSVENVWIEAGNMRQSA